MRNRFGGRWVALVSALMLTLVGCGDGDGAATPDAGGVDPGGLVRVTMDSKVGVLLDEFPAALRDRAAAQILARSESVWRTAVKKQIEATRLHLSYRRYFAVLAGQGLKAQLPLPPEEQWQISFDAAGATRTTIEGHDYVAIGYHFEGVLVSDALSPGRSEPALYDNGGVWDQPFVFPVDPEQLTARVKNACLRPNDSFDPLDAEGALRYYDFNCTAAGGAPPVGCHTGPATEDCKAALTAKVGSVSTSLHFERLPWSESVAASARMGVPTVQGADLEVRQQGLEHNYLEYVYIPADSCTLLERCVKAAGWRRVLKFDASLKNVGGRAVDLGAVQNSDLERHNVFQFSACHQHSHFRYYGDFEYGQGLGATGDKRAFCLLSTTRYANHEGVPLGHPYDSCGNQGIEAGWGDDYFAGLDCQWIDVTDLPVSASPTVAPLSFVANPSKFLCEGEPMVDANGKLLFEPTTFTTDEGAAIDRPMCNFLPSYAANNASQASVTIASKGSLVTEACRRGQIGPLRDCGFTEQGMTSCPVNTPVTVSCSAPAGSPPQLVRLCEYSQRLGTGIACTGPHALASGVWSGAPLSLSLSCPRSRDVAEVGGRLAVFAGPALDGDASALVTCQVQ